MATASQIRAVCEHAWPNIGAAVCDAWDEHNDRYWGGKLRPVPIVMTPTLPYGKKIGLCTMEAVHQASAIYLAAPRDGDHLVADRGVLCHEMIHAWLRQCGDDPKHSGQPWRDEIVRLSRIEGRTIVAMKTKVAKEKGTRRSVRVTPEGSLNQAEIAGWPLSIDGWSKETCRRFGPFSGEA